MSNDPHIIYDSLCLVTTTELEDKHLTAATYIIILFTVYSTPKLLLNCHQLKHVSLA